MRTTLGQAQAETYGVMHVPTLLMVDQQGTIRKRIVGVVSAQLLRQELELILADQ
jgi:thiol:disulfide interchange protein